MGCCSSNKNQELLCYCFNITKESFINALNEGASKAIKDFVVYQTKNNLCNCEVLNPSKQCCLKDFKKLEQSKSEKI